MCWWAAAAAAASLPPMTTPVHAVCSHQAGTVAVGQQHDEVVAGQAIVGCVRLRVRGDSSKRGGHACTGEAIAACGCCEQRRHDAGYYSRASNASLPQQDTYTYI